MVVVEVPDGGQAWVFSERLACVRCGVSFPEVSPRMFSFNNPYGACPACGGLGTRLELDPDLVVPDPRKSLAKGALAPWAGRESVYFRQTLAVLARKRRFSLDTPWKELSKATRELILRGTGEDGGFDGVLGGLERRYKETTSEDTRLEIERYMSERPCPACGGGRLRPESLAVRVGGRSIHQVCALTIKEAGAFFDALTLGEREQAIARRVLKEIRERLGFLRTWASSTSRSTGRPARSPAARGSGSASRRRSGRAWSASSTSSTSRRSVSTSGTTGGSSTRCSGCGTSATRSWSSSTTRRRSGPPTT